MSKSKNDFMDLREREDAEKQNRTTVNQNNTIIETGLTLTQKRLQELSKADITTLAQNVVLGVAEGLEDAMDTLIMGKKIEAIGKEIAENVKSYAYGKTYATKGNPYNRFNAKVEASELGVEYDYSETGDKELDALQTTFDTAKAALDKRKKFLQTLPGVMPTYDADTGETYDIHPAVKKSTAGYKISF